MKKPDPVVIYTDGGCMPNPGAGGWAAVLRYGDHIREISGYDPETTNNRMELTAAVEALKALKRPCEVELYTDSQYLQRGVTEWMPSWKKRGWVRKSGPVKNEDLWKALDRLVQKHDVQWRWVRGHAGNEMNERCDELASQEIARARAAGGGRA
jgi:ribonuclease HI